MYFQRARFTFLQDITHILNVDNVWVNAPNISQSYCYVVRAIHNSNSRLGSSPSFHLRLVPKISCRHSGLGSSPSFHVCLVPKISSYHSGLRGSPSFHICTPRTQDCMPSFSLTVYLVLLNRLRERGTACSPTVSYMYIFVAACKFQFG